MIDDKDEHVPIVGVDLVDLPPDQVVRATRLAHEAGDPQAADRLDRHLRRKVLTLLVRGEGDATALDDALCDAIDWVRAVELPRWEDRWACLLDVLEDRRIVPSEEQGLGLVASGGRAADVLRQLVAQARPVRPSELATMVFPASPERSARSQLSRVLGTLEGAGLISRRRLGRATLVSVLPLGRRVAERLAPASAPKPAERLVPAIALWHSPANDSLAGLFEHSVES